MHGGAESGGEMGRCMEELKAGGRWGDAWRS